MYKGILGPFETFLFSIVPADCGQLETINGSFCSFIDASIYGLEDEAEG